ncbi:GNAT family N-acetyltransferase [Pseudooceanicola sp. C21-150M6]|uniref:GNAT family N-acetyltransferase n=1 Tax=Pseudooceanicola sp. C21-150M6 TaxID=3434355 RepID=UPI003D7F2C1B
MSLHSLRAAPDAPPGPGLSDLIIRPAMPADTEGVSRMLARSYRALLAPDYPPDLLRETLPIISLARPSLLSCGTYFLAEIGERIVGAGGWTDASPHGAPGRYGVGHVRHVAVDPEVARCGVGTRILSRVFGSARSAGVTELRVQSTLTGEPFYLELGFKTVARIEVRLPTGALFPAVQMRHLSET